MFELKINEMDTKEIKILVIGVGGGGNNTVNRMVEDGVYGVHFVGVNTDNQDLALCQAETIVKIGEKASKGLGAGANPEVGEKSALQTVDTLTDIIRGADMVFVTCGMGGGTGTGATPVIAKIAHDMGILTVGVVTKPFRFEGKVRMNNAMSGIEKLRPNVDTLIVIPNDKLLEICDRKTTFPQALHKADEVLQQSIRGVTDLINTTGLINLDFADIDSVIRGSGVAHIGLGEGRGDNAIKDAVAKAISSPLLETSIEDAKSILVNIAGNVSLLDASEAVEMVQEISGNDTNVIFGTTCNDNDSTDAVFVTVIATGVPEKALSADEKRLNFQTQQVMNRIVEEQIERHDDQIVLPEPTPVNNMEVKIEQPAQQQRESRTIDIINSFRRPTPRRSY